MPTLANLGDTAYFHFGANDTLGSGADGATPAAHVRLCGAAVDAAPVLSPTPTLLTHATYPAGCHEVAVAATEGNGFAAGNEYAVFCTLAVDSQNPTGFVGSFKLLAVGEPIVPLNAQAIRDAQKLAPTAGDPATGSVDKHLDDIPTTPMRGTDGANTVAPATPANVTAAHATTDALVGALPSANAIRDAVFAKTGITAAGEATFATILAALYGAARGKIVYDDVAGTFAVYDDDDVTVLFTLTITAANRTTG